MYKAYSLLNILGRIYNLGYIIYSVKQIKLDF